MLNKFVRWTRWKEKNVANASWWLPRKQQHLGQTNWEWTLERNHAIGSIHLSTWQLTVCRSFITMKRESLHCIGSVTTSYSEYVNINIETSSNYFVSEAIIMSSLPQKPFTDIWLFDPLTSRIEFLNPANHQARVWLFHANEKQKTHSKRINRICPT